MPRSISASDAISAVIAVGRTASEPWLSCRSDGLCRQLAATFAYVGGNHARDDDGHGGHLNPFQMIDVHNHGRYGGEYRHKILVQRYQFRPDATDGGCFMPALGVEMFFILLNSFCY